VRELWCVSDEEEKPGRLLRLHLTLGTTQYATPLKVTGHAVRLRATRFGETACTASPLSRGLGLPSRSLAFASAPARRRLVGLSRFELLTPRLSSVCSNQLSYRPKPTRGRRTVSKSPTRLRLAASSRSVLSKLDRTCFANSVNTRSIV